MTLAQQVRSVLKNVFGFEHFRQYQGQIIKNIVEGSDVCAIMPTSAGKSLCYQFPSKLLDGTVIVISPLISLMKDQVDAAREIGINAAFLNRDMEFEEARQVFIDLMNDRLDLLYIAPERFALEGFAERLGNAKISLFAIDEAHCISEWGHDFRPDYLSVSKITEMFPDVPLATFTATATLKTQQDIIDRTGLRDPFLVRASFNRPNLFYEVVEKTDFHEQVLDFINARQGESGIIYRAKRDWVEETAAFLKSKGINALPYHAGMEYDVRRRFHDMFRRDEVDVVVATVAFGMGIDKPNIRYVVHADLPKTIESYYQETGRAGRDGEPAHCLLYFGAGDIMRMKFLLEKTEDKELREVALQKLNSVIKYASINICRRKTLLNYFDEEFTEENCGTCDICTDDRERVDATDEARMLIEAVFQTDQRYGSLYIVEVVSGAETARVLKNGHDSLEIYGAGKHHGRNYWRSMIDELVAQQYLQREPEYQVLKVTRTGRMLHNGQGEFSAAAGILSSTVPGIAKKSKKKQAAATSRKSAKEKPAKSAPSFDPDAEIDEALYERLRALRMKLANKAHKPAYVIFGDKTLKDMCVKKPVTPEEMLDVHGVGKMKLQKFGELFLNEIQNYQRNR